ncbi:MAG TPA: hypothetical protein VJI15_04500 [Candidatus Nanoarchaeia archaeon]|nr:hypothetical protein [Candidatus Nanoarchaeia archaeon]
MSEEKRDIEAVEKQFAVVFGGWNGYSDKQRSEAKIIFLKALLEEYGITKGLIKNFESTYKKDQLSQRGFRSDEQFLSVVILELGMAKGLLEEMNKNQWFITGPVHCAGRLGKAYGKFMAAIRYGILDPRYEHQDWQGADIFKGSAYITFQLYWSRTGVRKPAFIKNRIRTNIKRRMSIGKDSPEKKKFLTRFEAVFV